VGRCGGSGEIVPPVIAFCDRLWAAGTPSLYFLAS